MGESRSTGRVARDAAVEQTAATLVYLGITVAVSLAVIKRDALGRAWARLRNRPPGPDEVAEAAMLAELRRDLSRIEHG
jgi:hypothetical protein